MERLETKRIHGRTYYYYSQWEWRDGKCRRVWQKYLGKLEDIVRTVEEGGPCPRYAEVFQWGLSEALWQECCRANVCAVINRHVRKRDQGLTTGEYLAIATLNRAVQARSKRSMWQWFAATTLLRHLPKATAANLSSQRFWDHMDRIAAGTAQDIWQEILQGIVARENLDLSRVCYDGTNFYTFIDTFNTRCDIARRGKNKQGRNNLRQVSYALMWRRVCQAGVQISLKRLLSELQDIREIVNIYPTRGKQQTERRQTVLSKRNELQQRLLVLLGLTEAAKNAVLG
jgi:hypothetical protein